MTPDKYTYVCMGSAKNWHSGIMINIGENYILSYMPTS